MEHLGARRQAGASQAHSLQARFGTDSEVASTVKLVIGKYFLHGSSPVTNSERLGWHGPLLSMAMSPQFSTPQPLVAVNAIRSTVDPAIMEAPHMGFSRTEVRTLNSPK